MSLFGPDPYAFFERVYRQDAPWDIGGPQPAMAALLDEFPPEGPALDVGCGSGDLAIHVAERGIPAIGIDFVQTAIAQARQKQAALAPHVARRLEFQVGDALRPAALGRAFGAVLDSGFYHLFDLAEGHRLIDDVGRVLSPGGRYYLHAFAVTFPVPDVPRGVTGTELRERFTPAQGWQLLAVRDAEFVSRVGTVPAILACAQRLA